MSINGLGVAVFFSISGYFIVQSWLLHQDLRSFIVKRVLRVFPALIIVVLLSALVLGPIVTTLSMEAYFESYAFEVYLKNMFGDSISFSLPGVFQDNHYPDAVNGSLWTIPVEIQMYTVVGLTALLSLKRFNIIWFFLSGIIAIMYISEFHFDNSLSSRLAGPPLQLSIYFMLGGCFYLLKDRIPLNAWISLAFLILGIVAGSHIGILNVIAIAYISLTFGHMKTRGISKLSAHGDYSYGLYLYAFPIGQALMYFSNNQMGLYSHILLTTLISFVFAYISWHLIERRALSFKPRPQT